MDLKKKIAVIYLGRKGGGPVYAYEMTKGLIENGCEVYLFISAYVENLENFKTLNTCNTEIIKTYKGIFSFLTNTVFFRFFGYPALKKKYKNLSVDACYIPMEQPWDRYIVNVLNNPQKIVTVHDPIRHSSNNSSDKMLTKAVSVLNWGIYDKKPDDYVILSKYFFDHMVKSRGVAKERVHVIPHCVFDFYDKAKTTESFPYDGNLVNFLFFGRIDKYKGLEFLAEAFKKFYEVNDKATLTIVGSGDFSVYKEKYAGVPNLTVINRWIADGEVASFFVKNKNVILVLPYIDATQSGVIPIAMSSEIPVIASNTGGLAEQIIDNETGYLVEPANVESLFEKMKDVSEKDNRMIVKNAKDYISKLTGYELSKKIIEIID